MSLSIAIAIINGNGHWRRLSTRKALISAQPEEGWGREVIEKINLGKHVWQKLVRLYCIRHQGCVMHHAWAGDPESNPRVLVTCEATLTTAPPRRVEKLNLGKHVWHGT